MEIFIVWIVLAIGVGALADSRGRSGFGFFLVAAIFSPLIGLIVVLVIPNLTARAEAEKQRNHAELMREHERQREHEAHLASLKAMAAAPVAAAAAASRAPERDVSAGISVATELEKLVALKDRGVLTDAEFGEQKARLLRSAGP